MAEFLGVVKLGTLYHNGSPLSLPSRPWYSGNYPSSLSARGNGDIPQFSGNMSDWVVGDTSQNDSEKLKWVKIKDNDKILLICTLNVLNAILWDTLNAAGYVTGKKITIDGQEYLCRLLTGGDNYRSYYDNYSGGQPANEWDRFICNEDNIAGLVKPTSSDLDSSLRYDDLDGAHNKLWHWWGNHSWCKETYKENSSCRVLRGYESPRYFSYSNSTDTSSYYGWRPVLEVLNSAPKIDGEDSDLETQNKPFVLRYTISDANGNKVKVVEKVDDKIVQTIESVQLNKEIHMQIDPSSLKTLSSHKIEIIATNNSTGATAKRTYTFDVTASKYRLTLDKPIKGTIKNKDATIVPYNVFVNDKELVPARKDDRIVYNTTGIENNTVNLKITGYNTKIKKLYYIVY